MINTLSIVLSLVGVAYVVLRAIVLDKLVPWFGGKEDEFVNRGKTPAAKRP